MGLNILLLSDRKPLRDRLINLGDRALTDGLYRILERDPETTIISGGWKNFPYITDRLFSASDSEEDILEKFERLANGLQGYSATRLRLEKRLQDLMLNNPLVRAAPFRKLERKIEAQRSRGLLETLTPYLFRARFASAFLEKLSRADLVVYNGAGLIADHLHRYLPMEMFGCYLAWRLGKRVITVNQSVTVRNPLLRRMVSTVYRRLDFHITREPLSRRTLLELGIPESQTAVTFDSAFMVSLKPAQQIPDESIPDTAIGFAIRGDRPVNVSFWTTVIRETQQAGMTPYFFSTCPAHDARVLDRLSRELRLHTFRDVYDYPDLIPLLGRFRAVVTDRYHAVIFSILASTPVVAVTSITEKLEGLLTMLNYSIPPVPLLDTPACRGQVIQALQYFNKEQPLLRKELRIMSDHCRESVFSTYSRYLSSTKLNAPRQSRELIG